jgi:hypothetical protein
MIDEVRYLRRNENGRAAANMTGRGCTMASYKLSFLNSAGEVIAARTFTATSNFDAMQAATQMANRVQCAGFELSSKHRTITRQLRNTPEKRTAGRSMLRHVRPGDAG